MSTNGLVPVCVVCVCVCVCGGGVCSACVCVDNYHRAVNRSYNNNISVGIKMLYCITGNFREVQHFTFFEGRHAVNVKLSCTGISHAKLLVGMLSWH